MTRRRLLVLGLVGLVLLVVAGAAAAWYWNQQQTGDVRGSSSVEFDTTEPTTTRTVQEVDTEPWPLYGLTPERTRNASDFHHHPPFRTAWTYDAKQLLEFPPVIAYGRLYFCNIQGKFTSLDAETGKVDWSYSTGYKTAASPAVGDGVVYMPLISKDGTDPGPATGAVIAFNAKTGRILWRFRAGAVESSPLLVDGALYFGTFDHRLYALDAATKKVLWSVSTGDAVKGGPALWHSTIYTGSYDGKVYAIDARTGKVRWSSSSRGGLFGSGNFYATPAVAYGRVFIGNTDGRVYAYGAESGHLLWARKTGGYVYSSAAIADKTVFVGSYDGHLYALNAATGDVKWSYDAKGPVSGAPTAMEGLVYFSSFAGITYALDERSGKEVWRVNGGRYTPIVADSERTYLVGRTKLRALVER
jgi:outer membrane protein assembly factor BamB